MPNSPCRIRLITTGGTIGEVSHRDFVRRHMPAAHLLHALPDFGDRIAISPVDLLDLPSTFITLDHMLEVARAIDAAINEGTDGVVVTHGTATLEETAYFVDLVCPKTLPIVFTGAMLPQEVLGADGPFNLQNALLVASAPDARGRGVLVTLAGEIHAARDVTKTHAMSIAAFKSPEFGPLGTIDEDRVVFSRWAPPSETIRISDVTARVEGLKCYAAMSDIPLRALVKARFDGVVLETFGSGQVPPSLMPSIREAVEAGLAVVATTRCSSGRLLRGYYGLPIRAPGDACDLLEAGVIFSDLQSQKARIKLIVALSAGLGQGDLKHVFETGAYARP